ncbi:hypothetical protein O181_120923 [Austropuccinia psidii MF-1]|uniref:Uncharacterized protein n=1 Tax=Austropuccinia psidii MF-1 TaxID=1389203 RepID=A0A9Q3Q0T2_9BASI|nr:hypothetical protein [Austropuccinia psidii MF-1]
MKLENLEINIRTVHRDQYDLRRYSCGKVTPGITSHIPVRNAQTSRRIFQNSPFLTIPGSFQKEEKKRSKEQCPLQPKEEGERLNNAQVDGISTRGIQEQEIISPKNVVNSADTFKNLLLDIINETHTQSRLTPEPERNDLSSNTLWINMAKFKEWTYINMDLIEKYLK